jgi:hypothetical protein
MQKPNNMQQFKSTQFNAQFALPPTHQSAAAMNPRATNPKLQKFAALVAVSEAALQTYLEAKKSREYFAPWPVAPVGETDHIVKILLWTHHGVACVVPKYESGGGNSLAPHCASLIGGRQKAWERAPLSALKRCMMEQFAVDPTLVNISTRCWRFSRAGQADSSVQVFIGGYSGDRLTPNDASFAVAHITAAEVLAAPELLGCRPVLDAVKALPELLAFAEAERAPLMGIPPSARLGQFPTSRGLRRIVRVLLQLGDDCIAVLSGLQNRHMLPSTRLLSGETPIPAARRTLDSVFKIKPSQVSDQRLIRQIPHPADTSRSVALVSVRLTGTALPVPKNRWEVWRLRPSSFEAVASRFVAGWEVERVVPVLTGYLKAQRSKSGRRQTPRASAAGKSPTKPGISIGGSSRRVFP